VNGGETVEKKRGNLIHLIGVSLVPKGCAKLQFTNHEMIPGTRIPPSQTLACVLVGIHVPTQRHVGMMKRRDYVHVLMQRHVCVHFAMQNTQFQQLARVRFKALPVCFRARTKRAGTLSAITCAAEEQVRYVWSRGMCGHVECVVTWSLGDTRSR
jgi:hypothetical protein